MKVRVLERDGGDEVDEPREVRRIDLELGVVLVEDVLELRVLLLHRLQRVVDELAGGGDFIRVGETPTLLDLGPGRELVGGGPELFIELAEEGLGGTVRH